MYDLIDRQADLQPTCNNLATDCISRKAALDGIADYLEEYDGVDENGNHDLKWCAMKEAELLIKELPFVHEPYSYSQENDCISRQVAQTELMMKCERYTLARESHGMGHVEWSSDLISVADAMDAIRDLPSVQPETNCSGFPNTSDFVSRKAVREMVATWAYDLMEQEDLNMALHDVDELPPVSAERKRGKNNEGYF